ncbi:MAG TPA: tRNA (adenosine(37)-N6)-dimethylallyltransferase MiaA [Candidatus Paceibacterota bacterium]|nr:tRNA (adenosine(37)-N6)-dimethylallyltransferase MiaA [Candidatus Paceibacterota bacterium]
MDREKPARRAGGSNLPKIVVLLGQTASGKTALSIALAKRFGGEVISADSRQVYRGLDLGTGKVTKSEMARVPHHLLDVADPKRVYSVARFVRDADHAIQDILARGKLPIICGGTGFYIDALLSGAPLPDVAPNPELRTALKNRSTDYLAVMLDDLDPDRAATIDRKNPVRLIRAIEIATALGKVPARPSAPARYATEKIGIAWPKDALAERIHMRLSARMRQGMLAEAKRLHAAGLSWRRMEDLGLEYRYMARHLRGDIDRATMLRELERAIVQYAKRQMTWFKRDHETHWLKPEDAIHDAEELVNKFLTQ